MSKLPFIIAENDLNLRMLRVLIIIRILSYSVKKNPILTIEKIAAYNYLLTYPAIFGDILKLNDSKQIFQLEEYEYYNIEANLNNRKTIYNFELLNKILQMLITYKYISVINNKKIFYVISDEGIKFLSSLESEYTQRMIYLCKYLLKMRSLDFQKIDELINLSFERRSGYEC